jgi:hypothetical protein
MGISMNKIEVTARHAQASTLIYNTVCSIWDEELQDENKFSPTTARRFQII